MMKSTLPHYWYVPYSDEDYVVEVDDYYAKVHPNPWIT
jgi:hypothetical protein